MLKKFFLPTDKAIVKTRTLFIFENPIAISLLLRVAPLYVKPKLAVN